MSVLTRFKSDEKLQAEALDILEEMIRRNLLAASVSVAETPVFLSCPIREAIVAEGRPADINELLTGKPSINKRARIELVLDQPFRLTSDDEAQRLRYALRNMTGPAAGA